MLSKTLGQAETRLIYWNLQVWRPLIKVVCSFQQHDARMYSLLQLIRPSNLSLAMLAVLQMRPGFIIHFGLCCNSWVVVSRGSTLRHFLAPDGNPAVRSVREGNTLLARQGLVKLYNCYCKRFAVVRLSVCVVIERRFVLLALLIHACGGHWSLEQPASSLLFRAKRFQWLCRILKAPWLEMI